MSQILFLEPVFKEAVWGGSKLSEEFGYQIPGAQTGECWAISAHKSGDCKIRSGEYAGKTLSWLWENYGELFGGGSGGFFPLLVKIIDAKEDLSIQVHPGDSYAEEFENGSLGKTECWYVLDCEEGATIIIGHNAESKEELVQMIEEGRWKDLIRELPVKKGDFFQINPGTVHAIKGGIMLLETQQSSDITYRLYDYDRRYNGELRELHIQKSIDVIQNPYVPEETIRHIVEEKNYRQEHLVECEFYSVSKLDIHGSKLFALKHPFQLFSVIEGEGKIEHHKIKKGDHFIVPKGCREYTLEGNMQLITSHI